MHCLLNLAGVLVHVECWSVRYWMPAIPLHRGSAVVYVSSLENLADLVERFGKSQLQNYFTTSETADV